MTRNRKSAKDAGRTFANSIVDALKLRFPELAEHLDRRVQSGAGDRGDIAGLPGLAIEAKCHAAYGGKLPGWLKEAETERVNAGAMLGVVWHKRVGKANAAEAFVSCTGETFMELLEAWLRYH
jgi:hypothetical protein